MELVNQKFFVSHFLQAEKDKSSPLYNRMHGVPVL
jgi:hypothetical protein